MVIAIDAETNETCPPGAFEGVHWACRGTGFCKYWKQMRNSKSSEVMTHHSVGDISIAGTVYALLMGPRGAPCTASTSTAGRLRDGSCSRI